MATRERQYPLKNQTIPEVVFNKRLGIRNFEAAFDLGNKLTKGSRGMRPALTWCIEVKGPLSIDIEFGAQMTLIAFNDAMLDENFNNNFIRNLFQSDVKLLNINIGFKDYGIFNKIVNFHTENIPNEGPRLLLVVDRFLQQREQIVISAYPDVPVPLLNLFGYWLMITDVIKKYYMTIKWVE